MLGVGQCRKIAEVPQLLFFDGRRFPRRGAEADAMVQTVRRTTGIPQLLNTVTDVQRLALMVQTVQSPVEFPQVQFLVWDVDMPAVGQSLALMVQTVQMPVEVPQVQYLDKDVLIPVIARLLQYRNPWSSHRCCSGTRMLTCSLLCQTGFWSRRADNSGVSAIAVLHQGCGHAR